MKKILLLLLFITLIECDINQAKYDGVNDIVYQAIGDFWKDTIIKERISNCVIKYSKAHNLDPLLVNRVIEIESSYRYWKVNPISGCVGLTQIQPRLWNHVLFTLDSHKLGKYIIKNNITNADMLSKYWQRIGYSIEGGCIVIRHYIDMYDGDIYKAMKVYSGNMTKRALKNPEEWLMYSNKIFSPSNY